MVCIPGTTWNTTIKTWSESQAFSEHIKAIMRYKVLSTFITVTYQSSHDEYKNNTAYKNGYSQYTPVFKEKASVDYSPYDLILKICQVQD
ncbi:hypothetical protein WA026_010209 [Henosepilachna vigintioctopunctata]|uniref:Uncharacterized protein n=1 Tax=Henosepilachna vigintioctopunctata TaxID=420089 RepID=A0AAW1UIH1_9CUCU